MASYGAADAALRACGQLIADGVLVAYSRARLRIMAQIQGRSKMRFLGFFRGSPVSKKGIHCVAMVFPIWRWFILSFPHSNLLNAQLMHGAQASSADADTHLLAIDDHGFFLGVELPLPISSVLRVANIVTKLRRLTTYIALS